MTFVEKSFLGTLIKAGYLIKDTVVRPEQLEKTHHQELMRVMKKLSSSGKTIDIITLSALPNLHSFGGISYINELAAHANTRKFEEIEDLVIEKWKEREKRNILLLAAKNDWNIGKITAALDKINQSKIDDHKPISEALSEIYEAPWEEMKETKTAASGIKKLDEITGGFQNGELTILAARPSMGKTDVMLHFAKVAGWAGFLPIVFSLEMPEKLITKRLIASTGRFNRIKMRNPKKFLTAGQKARWIDVITNVNETNIQIFDGAGQSIQDIRAKIRKMIHQFPDKNPVVFIDYLTLIRYNESFGGNIHLQVTEISKSLKTMAKEFDIPVICLAQLNRSVEARSNKRPLMSDIRESGSIEQDADVILFLYRESYYDRDSRDDLMEIIVAKNRNGPIGVIRVKYNEYTGEIIDEEQC